jgi:hypothetical protein
MSQPDIAVAPPVSQKYTQDKLAFLEKQQTVLAQQEMLEEEVAQKRRQMPTPEILVQGGSLKTWAFMSPAVERVQVVLKTEGRPFDADVELWAGPDHTPDKMRVYVEHGKFRPFSTVLETPRGPNTIAVRNVGQAEFPLIAQVDAVPSHGPLTRFEEQGKTVQGGSLRTYPFPPNVDSVEVLLRTDGRPLSAKIELLQGPNTNKQVIEVYTEDGLDRPFYAVLQTPGGGNVVRIVNTATVEFPMTAHVVAFTTSNKVTYDDLTPIIK